MAKGLLKNYTFNTAAKTITLTDVTTVRLDKIALITDVTTNKILYNFADLSVATATVATNVITLSALQGGEANSDKLRIDYDVESTDTSAFADTTQPVSMSTIPTGAATSALQTTGNTSVASIDTKTPALGQALAASSVPVTLTALEEGLIGALTETAPATDTASSGLNGRLQRIAQRITSLIALIPTALGQGTMATSFKVVLPSDQSAIPVTLTSTTVTGTVSENLAQVNGVTVLTGTGAQGTGSQRVTVATDSATVAGSASIPAGTNLMGKVGIDQTTPGTTNRVDIGTVNGQAPAFGTGVRGGTVQRVTVATDDLVPISAASLPLPTLAATSTKQSDGTQKTQIVDGSGNVAGTTTTGANIGLNTQVAGITFTLSTVNSSTAQLAAGATFTGSIESAFNQPAAQLLCFSDQPYTVFLDQYDGGSNLIGTTTFTRAANVGLNENVQVNGDSCRIRVLNTGSVTTTTLRIETTYGPLNPLPVANTNLGNLKVALNEISGTATDSGAGNSSAGTLRVMNEIGRASCRERV